MINLVKIISTEIENFTRVIKLLRYGKDDVRLAEEAMPFGVDSNPIKNMIAVYAETGAKGDKVIIGYINKNQIAATGEFRTFSTDENGTVVFAIHQKNDGTCEIGGSSRNMVRYQELESAFNQLKNDFNDLVGKFNNHVHSGVTTGAGSSGVTATPANTSSADISNAKIEEIKTL